MSREILFRFYNKNLGQMQYADQGFQKTFDERETGPEPIYKIFCEGKYKDGSVCSYYAQLWLQRCTEIMQFTGLLDKNGVEIYENDIIEWKEHNIIFKVEWSQEDCGYVCHRDFPMSCGSMNQMYLDHFVIIGNIHQNPELLKDKS